MKKRTSLIWKIPKSELQEIVSTSSSIREILSHFGLENKGNNYKTLQSRFNEDNIDFTNIKLGLSSNKGRKFPRAKKFPLSEILIENSSYNNNRLKGRLIKEGLLENKCYICGQLPEWNGKPLTLQIDHMNGINNDNRIENLRILCPHCHSQTDNFAGKNSANKHVFCEAVPKKKCRTCDNLVSTPKSDQCITCRRLNFPTKANYPPDAELVILVNNSSYEAVGRLLGVTGNTVKKRLKTRNLLHLIN